MNLEEELKDAIDRVAGYRCRFRNRDDDFLPIQAALEYQRLLETKSLFSNEGVDAIRNIIKQRDALDICFFTFCNHLDRVRAKVLSGEFYAE